MTNYPNIESFYKENSRSLIKGEYRPVVSYNKDAEEYINKLVKIYEDNGCPEYVTVSQIEKGLNVTRGSNVATTESPLTWLGLGLIEDSNEILNKKDPNYKYKLTDDFLFIAQNKLIPGVHILNKLYSIKSLSTISKFTNLLICTLREGYIEDCIIDFPRDNKDYVDRVKDIVKRREYSSRVDKIYGYGLDTDSSPHASMRAINNLVKLELIKQQGENEYGFPKYQITEFGHRLLEVIDSNLSKSGIQDFHKKDKAPLQQIFYGAPGTGKSFQIKTDVEDAGEIYFRTTFHPDSDYSTFVGCYKPTMDKDSEANENVGMTRDGEYNRPRTKGNIIYSFTPQAFTNAYVKAWQTEESVFLIIEEINRGNCAQIFGDLFQLLDRDENGYSQYKVDADTDLADYIRDHLIKRHRDGTPDFIYAENELKLQLPNNLYIWATMNTSDQSLFPIDSAFKRRWEWVYSPIAKGKEKDGSEAKWEIEGQGEDSWWKFIQGINEIIDITTHSEDKKLGFYFCKPTQMVDGYHYPKIIKKTTFVNKVVFYLWNDVFKVYGFKSEIFDMKEENGTSKKITFKTFYNDDGSVNDEIVNVFVNNVMAKAPKVKAQGEEQSNEQNDTQVEA